MVNDMNLLTSVLKACNRLYSRNYHRVRQLSACPLPRTGPAILIANHISAADPFLIQGTSHRVIHWMMAKEYFDLPIVQTLCRKLAFIPVNRAQRDSSSLKSALRILAEGGVLGLFPEGRISPSRALLPFQPGLSLLVNRGRAPVFPVAVERFPRNLSLLQGLLIPEESCVLYGPVIPVQAQSTEFGEYMSAVQILQKQALALSTPCRRPVF